ncbi:MAG: hypothetical protein U0797_18955 [Gemmataceae bacterium]
MRGEVRAADAQELVSLATLCQKRFKRLYATSASFYLEAFSADPTLARNVSAGHRYNAACVAALVAAGQGEDTAGLGEMGRNSWRLQALTWLDADLNAWRKLLDKDAVKAQPIVVKTMKHWLADDDLAGVRGAEALGRFSAGERAAWQALWDEVARLAELPGAPKAATAKPGDKDQGRLVPPAGDR